MMVNECSDRLRSEIRRLKTMLCGTYYATAAAKDLADSIDAAANDLRLAALADQTELREVLRADRIAAADLISGMIDTSVSHVRRAESAEAVCRIYRKALRRVREERDQCEAELAAADTAAACLELQPGTYDVRIVTHCPIQRSA